MRYFIQNRMFWIKTNFRLLFFGDLIFWFSTVRCHQEEVVQNEYPTQKVGLYLSLLFPLSLYLLFTFFYHPLLPLYLFPSFYISIFYLLLYFLSFSLPLSLSTLSMSCLLYFSLFFSLCFYSIFL